MDHDNRSGHVGGRGRHGGNDALGKKYQNQQSGNYQEQGGQYKRGGGGGDWQTNQHANSNQASGSAPTPQVYQPEIRPVQNQGGVYVPPGRRRLPQPESSPTQFEMGSASRYIPPARRRAEMSQLVNDLQSLQFSEKQPPRPFAPEGSVGNVKQPIRRPDNGGVVAMKPLRLLVNHFPVTFSPTTTIMHYDIEIKQDSSAHGRVVKKVPQSLLPLVREKLCFDNPNEFPLAMTSYDGGKNLFSAIPLPSGSFNVQLSGKSYILSIKFVNELKLSKLKDYLSGNLVHIPRDVLQGLDVVMKENSSEHMISVGRSMYSREYKSEYDLHCGVAAFRGLQKTLKPTNQGLVLCLDYSIIAFRKKMWVIDFLKEHIPGFEGVGDVVRLRREVGRALKGLKVKVTHRKTKQKYTIAGLTDKNTRYLTFRREDVEGQEKQREVLLVDYFRAAYNKDILYTDIPCLDVGKDKKKPNYLPMEFCVLADDKRVPKENLRRNAGILLKELAVISPKARKSAICELVQGEHGSHGACSREVARNFGLEVNDSMTRVQGRLISPPNLKMGTISGKMSITAVDKDKGRWSLAGKSVVHGKSISRWALIDFSSGEREHYRLNPDRFTHKLMEQCRNLGIQMEPPLVVHSTGMYELSKVYMLEKLLVTVMEKASNISHGRLQIIICAMTRKDDGYKNIKWVSETKIGVITQCFLTENANRRNEQFVDQYLANLSLKINAKLGGSNVELVERLPLLEKYDDRFMFIGADVNHPAPSNRKSPSVAAVVGTVNWPAANRYAARVAPQANRKEEITNFGSLCLDLINAYARINHFRPNKIVIFRDGVSDAQFDMVLNKELVDLKTVLYEEHRYSPTITVVVAQKRHQTRLFLENEEDGVPPGNIPPGTVVDTTIVHPYEFDFYLCSHFGSLGTSKATHYSVIWDEHNYSSDQIQKLIYDLCFTFARCSKPPAVVPPVYYADLVASRGRLFQEAALQHSRTSVVGSASAASISADIYKLHPELENFMFFL